MNAKAPATPSGSGFETALIAAGAVVLAAGFGTGLGARLAVALGGGHVDGGLDLWLRVTTRLLRGAPPSVAWGESAQLPAAGLYWGCTAVVGLALVGVGGGVVMLLFVRPLKRWMGGIE